MKILLYVLAGILSAGIFLVISIFLSPFFMWLTDGDLQHVIPVVVGVMGGVAVICFITLQLIASRNKKKGKRNNLKVYYGLILFVLPVGLSLVGLYAYLDDHYYGFYTYRDYYVNRGTLYTKYGKALVSHDGLTSCGNNRFYMYNREGNHTGSIYDLDEGRFILKNTNLYYGSEKFSENGRNGFVASLTGDVVLPAIYDKLYFLDEGWVIACKDGKYGMLTSLGEPLLDFEYESYHRIDAFDGVKEERQGIICLEDDDGWYYVYILSTDRYNRILETEYEVMEVYKKNRFKVKDSNGSYRLINGRGDNLLGPYEYMSYNEDENTIKYGRDWYDLYGEVAMP